MKLSHRLSWLIHSLKANDFPNLTHRSSSTIIVNMQFPITPDINQHNLAVISYTGVNFKNRILHSNNIGIHDSLFPFLYKIWLFFIKCDS